MSKPVLGDEVLAVLKRLGVYLDDHAKDAVRSAVSFEHQRESLKESRRASLRLARFNRNRMNRGQRT